MIGISADPDHLFRRRTGICRCPVAAAFRHDFSFWEVLSAKLSIFNFMTHYQVLGLGRSASTEEIRKSYRRLAMRYHPDRNSDPSASEKFLRVQKAYEVLINSGSRENYDYTLNAGSVLSSRPLSRAEQKDPGYRRSRMSQQMKPDFASKKAGKPQGEGDFRMLENVLFYSLLIIGFIAIFFSARDLWNSSWDSLNNFTGITFGLSFTALLIYSWTQIYRKKN